MLERTHQIVIKLRASQEFFESDAKPIHREAMTTPREMQHVRGEKQDKI